MKISRWLLIPMLMVFVVLSAPKAHAAAVNVTWLSNSDADLAGYKVYYGSSSHNYQWYVDVGLTTSLQINNLTNGVTYYFSVTAYDDSGNESTYSQEVPAAIPEQGGETPGDGTQPLADTDTDGIPDSVELLWGLDPYDPLDSLMDVDGDGVVNLVEYMASTDPLNPADRPSADDILKDVIGEVGETIDLSAMNPSGTYTIVPLMAATPTVADNLVDMTEPGAYLYNVYDADGTLVYRLRVSVTSQLFAEGSFEPGTQLNLEELSMGVTIQLGQDASIREIPIGIGTPAPVSASAVSESDSIEFDLMPYGLALAEPATITVNFDKENPVVQRYDEDESAWKDITDITISGGMVSFSTQELGKFRVYSEASAINDVPASSGGGGGGGGGCFISSAGL